MQKLFLLNAILNFIANLCCVHLQFLSFWYTMGRWRSNCRTV